MKHRTHIERAALGQTVSLWLEANQGKRRRPPWKKTAAAINASPRRCKRALKYWNEHKDDPRIREFGELSHAAVVHYGFKGIETLRESLLRNFSASTGLAKPKLQMSNREIAKMADICGLEHFLLNGRRFIHWKHSKPKAES